MTVIDATEAVTTFHQKLIEYSQDWLSERRRFHEPLSELTDEHIRWVVLSDGGALLDEHETAYLRQVLDCDPVSYAVGFVSALLDASRRMHAQRHPRLDCTRRN